VIIGDEEKRNKQETRSVQTQNTWYEFFEGLKQVRADSMTRAYGDVEGGRFQKRVDGRFSRFAFSLRHSAIANMANPIVLPPRCAKDLHKSIRYTPSRCIPQSIYAR
jgi:hypothetical protein